MLDSPSRIEERFDGLGPGARKMLAPHLFSYEELQEHFAAIDEERRPVLTVKRLAERAHVSLAWMKNALIRANLYDAALNEPTDAALDAGIAIRQVGTSLFHPCRVVIIPRYALSVLGRLTVRLPTKEHNYCDVPDAYCASDRVFVLLRELQQGFNLRPNGQASVSVKRMERAGFTPEEVLPFNHLLAYPKSIHNVPEQSADNYPLLYLTLNSGQAAVSSGVRRIRHVAGPFLDRCAAADLPEHGPSVHRLLNFILSVKAR